MKLALIGMALLGLLPMAGDRNHEGSGLKGRRLPSQPTELTGHEGARRPLKPGDSFSGPTGQNRYNVLFIAIDDLRPELGCYGVKEAQSPNLDRLAKSGMLFTRQYAAVPTCGASRYALLTGRSPRNTGVTANNEAFYPGKTALDPSLLSGAQSLPEQFHRSGYQTVCIGKVSHTADGRVYAYNGVGDGRPELPNAWDALPTPFGAWQRGWGIFFAYEGGKHREDGQKHDALLEFTAKNDDDLPTARWPTRPSPSSKALKTPANRSSWA